MLCASTAQKAVREDNLLGERQFSDLKSSTQGGSVKHISFLLLSFFTSRVNRARLVSSVRVYSFSGGKPAPLEVFTEERRFHTAEHATLSSSAKLLQLCSASAGEIVGQQ